MVFPSQMEIIAFFVFQVVNYINEVIGGLFLVLYAFPCSLFLTSIYARLFFCSIQCYHFLDFFLLSVFRLLSRCLFCSLWALLLQFLSKAKLNFSNWKKPIYIFCSSSELLLFCFQALIYSIVAVARLLSWGFSLTGGIMLLAS